jgi:putative thioredoxin
MAANSHVIDVTEATFQSDVIERSRTTPVVVDFWAPWCGPCRTLGPVLERLAGEASGAFVLAKINVDNNPQISMRYGIQGIPAVKAFRDGQVVAEFVGAQPEPNVRRFLKQVVPNEAEALLQAGRWAEAEAVLRRALGQQPGQPALLLGLVRALIGQGKGCEAETAAAQLPEGPEKVEATALRPLAALLCEAQSATAGERPAIEAQFLHAGRLAAQGQYASAMDGLIEIVRKDRGFRDDEPRRVMLALFQWLGEEHSLTREYRQELASALY